MLTHTLHRSDAALRIVAPTSGSSIGALATTLEFDALLPVTLDAVYVGARRVSKFDGRFVPLGTSFLSAVPLVPGPNDIRIVYHRADGGTEVINSELTSTLSAVATLRGQVIDAATGDPIHGAAVKIVAGEDEFFLSSGPDGRFATSVAAGPFSVSVRRIGFRPASILDETEVGETVELAAPLLRWTSGIVSVDGTGSGSGTSRILGVVTSADAGLPLSGAEVRVASPTATLVALSAGDGTFEINGIPVGPFSASVTKSGYVPVTYEVPSTQAVDVQITPSLKALSNDVTVVATVRNALTDAFEPGVRATLLGPNMRVLSDANGTFRFTHVPIGVQSLRLEKPGYLDAVLTFEARPRYDGGPTELALAFPREAGSGRFLAVSPGDTAFVRDRFSQRGIAGAQVEVEGQTIVADENGAFAIPALSELDAHDLTASAPSYEPETLRIVIAPRANEPVAFGLVSQVRGAVSGTVRDAATGAGLDLATVKVAGSEDQLTHTNSDGSFLLDGVTPGTYELDVAHPDYQAGSVSSVVVAAGETAPADAQLDHRPIFGGIRGQVLDADSGAPIAGATVSHGALSTTSDALGHYELTGLPAGMTTVELSAPGYPASMRDVAVAADRDASTPIFAGIDLRISAGGDGPADQPAEIGLLQGGRVSDPSGHLTLILPPLSLNEDARVTVRLSAAPEVLPGQALPLDPGLQAPEIRAVGPEMEIRLEPVVPGGRVPQPVAPWILVQRYSAANASTSDVDERLIAPYVWNGSGFTLPRIIPYMHAVDRVDKVALTAIDPGATITGTPVFAAATLGKDFPLHAAVDGPQPTSSAFTLYVQIGARQKAPAFGPAAFVVVRDLRQEPSLVDPNLPETEHHPNSYPVIGIHGWDPKSIFLSTAPILDPFDPLSGDERFAQIFSDLVRATAGIYRPIWTSYDTGARARATAWAMFSHLRGALGGDIHGIPSDPNDPSTGFYDSVDVLGFSKGGLVGRSLLCTPSVGVQGLVALASPHHGAMSRLRTVLDLPFHTDNVTLPPEYPGTLRELLERQAPGTAELLDYSDSDPSENPYLWRLNRSRCSGAVSKAALISGNDPISIDVKLILPAPGQLLVGLSSGMESMDLVPAGTTAAASSLPQAQATEILIPLFSVGRFLNGGESDGIVPVWSAQGRDRDGIAMPPFAQLDSERLRVPEPAPFNHLEVGTQRQPLGSTLDDSVLPTLRDWFTTTQTGVATDVPKPGGEPGERIYTARTQVEWFSAEGKFTGFVQVLYGKDAAGNWHLLYGADSESGEIGEPGVTSEGDTNSVQIPANEKTMADPMHYRRPVDSNGNPISLVTTEALVVPLPYVDPDAPDTENVLPVDRLPEIGFRTAIR